MAEWHPAAEEYCEAIFELGEDHIDVVQARIAERVGVSRAAVSLMVRRLDRDGLVEIEEGRISLSADGLALAERVVRRHRLAERLLTDMLGLTWAEAHHEAGKWEHVISPRVERAMAELLGDPTTCPHGNPIPGSGYAPPDVRALTDIEVGGRFVVERITETLESTEGLLDFLETAGIKPGRPGTVTAHSPDGTVTVALGDRTVGVGVFAADRILVADGSERSVG
ncbi:MAG: metal-dependent transcriptional regulator [Microthrixaceae bacterium]